MRDFLAFVVIVIVFLFLGIVTNGSVEHFDDFICANVRCVNQ